MPKKKGHKPKPWHCSICGRVYQTRNATKRDVLNSWWKHMKKYHPSTYKKKKRSATKKAVATRKKKH